MDITAESIVFLIFSLITLGGALMVVTTRNLFHAALYLMVSLFGVAGLFVLLTAPLLAGFQIVVYIGAIAILIIFAIMLTPQVMQVAHNRTVEWIAAAVAAGLLFLLLFSVLTPLMDELGVDNWNADFTQDDPARVPDDTLIDLGDSLVDTERYVLPFEVASLLLMTALIGAVVMVAPGRTSEPDEQPAEQSGG